MCVSMHVYIYIYKCGMDTFPQYIYIYIYYSTMYDLIPTHKHTPRQVWRWWQLGMRPLWLGS